MNKQNQKGITLIALIITIIVMLILVGVTINVALNGGLFQKAEEAKTGTQLSMDREELQIAVVSALNDNREIPNAATIKNNLQEGWEVTGSDGGPYTCISPNGNVFEVDKKGNVKPGNAGNTILPAEDSDLDYIKSFFMGTDVDSLSTKVEINQESGSASFDNGKILFSMSTFEEMKNKYAPGEILVSYKENYYEVKYNDEAIAYDAYKWGTVMPVVVIEGGGSWYGDVEPSLSNTAFQKPGEYKTTIMLGNGQYNISDNLVTISINSMTGKTYVEGTDYTFNTSTGEIVIFNLTESIGVNITVERKTT